MFLIIDTCYSGKWKDAGLELARNNQIPDNVTVLAIYTFASSETKLNWGCVSKLYANYTKGKHFRHQSEAWKALFDAHVRTYGFGDFVYSRHAK